MARRMAALAGVVVLLLSACDPRAPAPSAPAAASVGAQGGDAREQFSRLVERYWDERAPPETLLAPQSVADALSVERRYLAELASVPRLELDAQGQQTFDIFKRQREESVEGFTYPSELLPLDPFGGLPLQFAMASADLQAHPFANAAGYEDWLKRIQAYVLWTRQATVNLREGLRRGYTEPKPVVDRMLPILRELGADTSTNVFYAPLRSMPDSIKDPDRTRLSQALNRALAADLLPANRALAEFLQRDYQPHARSTLALSALPLGSAWYAFRLKQATGTPMSAADLHRMGLIEVERLRGRLQSPRASLVVAADPIEGYKQLAVLVRAAMPSAFAQSPTEDFEIRSTAFDEEPAGVLFYHAASARGRAAILYVRTSPPAPISIPEFLQMAEPGRHYLTALQQQSTLPRFPPLDCGSCLRRWLATVCSVAWRGTGSVYGRICQAGYARSRAAMRGADGGGHRNSCARLGPAAGTRLFGNAIEPDRSRSPGSDRFVYGATGRWAGLQIRRNEVSSAAQPRAAGAGCAIRYP